MSTKKQYILTSGVIGRIRNGDVFTSSYHRDFGHFITFDDGIPILATDWSEKQLRHNKSEEMDIMALYKPTNLMDLSNIFSEEFSEKFFAKNKPFWQTSFPTKEKKPVDPPGNDIKVMTELTVLINNKPVDLQNLSADERAILIHFGVISSTNNEEEE